MLQKVRGIRHQQKPVFTRVNRNPSVFNLNIVAKQPVPTSPTLKLRRVESLLLRHCKRPELQLLIVIQNNMCYRSGIMSSNEKTISFRAVAEKIEALDSLATAQERPRSYLINEAISNYIELHAYQDALVRKGLQEMRKGRVVSHEQVLKRLKRTGRARQ